MAGTIQAIIFDCFGVLATDSWEAFIDNLPSGADKAAARQARHAYDAGLINKVEHKRLIKIATGREFIGAEDGGVKVAKNHKLLTYIRELRRRQYKIGMLSNAASNWLREEFLSLNEQSLFDDFSLSYELGIVKPEPRIFMISTERLCVAPSAAVLVDDKERYCQAAQNVGLQAVLYRNYEQCRRELEILLTV